MAVLTKCDQCGGAPAHRVTADMASSIPGKAVELPRVDVDLCVPCAKRAATIVAAAFPPTARP